MRKLVLACVGSMLGSTAWGQTSILQDKAGESTLALQNNVGLIFNAGDANFTLSVPYATSSFFIGATAKLKAEEGIANILKGNKLKPQLEFSTYIGKPILDDARIGITCAGYVGVRFNTSQFSTVTDTLTNAIAQRRFDGFVVTLGLNRLAALPMWLGGAAGLAPSYLFGASISGGQFNNVSALETVDIYKIRTAANSTAALYSKQTAFAAGYQSGNQIRLNADFFAFPRVLFNGHVGIGGYIRGQLFSNFKSTNAGVGAIFGHSNAPADINFGLFYQFQDIWQNQSTEANLFKRSGINLVAGFSI